MTTYSESNLYADFLEKTRCRLSIDLHPSSLASAQQGVREYLNGLLLRYNEDLEGVVLSYQKDNILKQAAIVHPYFPFTRVEVTAELIIFKPQPGKKIVGVVNKIADSYIGVLILGFMNAAIRSAHIRPDIQPSLAEGCWSSRRNPNHKLESGSSVVFTIAAVERHGAFITLSGSLEEANTGNIEFVKLAEDVGKKSKKKKAEKEANGSKALLAAGAAPVEEKTDKKAEKKKKKRNADDPSGGKKSKKVKG